MTTLTKVSGYNTKTIQSSPLEELFLKELKDIYWAERALVHSLPKLAKAATTDTLKQTFEDHLLETKKHVVRLEKIFAMLYEKPEAKKCDAMAGIIEEADELIDDTDSGSFVRDVALITVAQKMEHYEIASYGNLRSLAHVLGYVDAAGLLNQTLNEEKHTDTTLTMIGERKVNSSAGQEH